MTFPREQPEGRQLRPRTRRLAPEGNVRVSPAQSPRLRSVGIGKDLIGGASGRDPYMMRGIFMKIPDDGYGIGHDHRIGKRGLFRQPRRIMHRDGRIRKENAVPVFSVETPPGLCISLPAELRKSNSEMK